MPWAEEQFYAKLPKFFRATADSHPPYVDKGCPFERFEPNLTNLSLMLQKYSENTLKKPLELVCEVRSVFNIVNVLIIKHFKICIFTVLFPHILKKALFDVVERTFKKQTSGIHDQKGARFLLFKFQSENRKGEDLSHIIGYLNSL